jgi:hypothetical protein
MLNSRKTITLVKGDIKPDYTWLNDMLKGFAFGKTGVEFEIKCIPVGSHE